MKIEPTPSELSELFIRGFKPVDEAACIELSSIAKVCADNPSIYSMASSINGAFLYNLLNSRDPAFPVFIKRFDVINSKDFNLSSIVVAGSFSSFGLEWSVFMVTPGKSRMITATSPTTVSLIEALKDVR